MNSAVIAAKSMAVRSVFIVCSVSAGLPEKGSILVGSSLYDGKRVALFQLGPCFNRREYRMIDETNKTGETSNADA
ncbi:MAG: hypothetical protein E5Y58_31475, partial [Mesorhizobium sp.]